MEKNCKAVTHRGGAMKYVYSNSNLAQNKGTRDITKYDTDINTELFLLSLFFWKVLWFFFRQIAFQNETKCVFSCKYFSVRRFQKVPKMVLNVWRLSAVKLSQFLGLEAGLR